MNSSNRRIYSDPAVRVTWAVGIVLTGVFFSLHSFNASLEARVSEAAVSRPVLPPPPVESALPVAQVRPAAQAALPAVSPVSTGRIEAATATPVAYAQEAAPARWTPAAAAPARATFSDEILAKAIQNARTLQQNRAIAPNLALLARP
jgi:hypothetical protein